jgi:hypothetical protein
MHGQKKIKAEKVFTKWFLGKFSAPVQSMAEVHICTRGLF